MQVGGMNLGVVRRRHGGDTDASSPGSGTNRDDEGFSLIEVVMTIVLMATVLLPIMNAAITAVKASSSTRRIAELQTVLLNAADRVNRAPVKCDYTVYIQAAAQTKGWPPGQASATYEWYEPGANAGVAGTWHSGACNGSTPSQNLVQRVTITMASPEANVSRTIQVVKSDV
jgi:prepilin-type N-terminal cleavage/methylation domain-containing protein